ncbi:MAG TPA: hypothetical protein VLC93_03260 [Myxococcota bacterium]|nr:hypothetical protein [Myxococcota bacterium]
MSLVNGTTTVRRLGAPAEADRAAANGALQPTATRGDTFEVDSGARVMRADLPTGTGGTTGVHRVDDTARATTNADVVRQVGTALNTARETLAEQRARADATIQPGAVMSKADAVEAVVDIYSKAFPGIGFTEGELASAIEMLRTGKVTVDELRARVEEGAKLINDPNAMADKAAEMVEAGRPNRRSVVAQQLRMERLATLMEMGFVPEGKFNVVGGFSYNGKGTQATGQYLAGIDAKGATAQQLRSAAAGLTRDMARTMERYRTNSRATGSDVGAGDDDNGGNAGARGLARRGLGPTLIRGRATNDTGPANSQTAFGHSSTNQVSLSGATSSGLSQASSELSGAASQTGSPVMLDLNHDNALGVTGNSTAKHRADDQVNATVDFDLDADGVKERIEWMKGDGDGMLVDDRDGGASAAAAGNGEIDGKRLFGDEGGKYLNGYEKMKALDANGDGKLNGTELDGLKSWIDDGDAKVEAGELKTLAELGVSEIDLKMELTANDRCEMIMRSTFTQNGERHVSEDVWFAEDPRQPNLQETAATIAANASDRALANMIATIDATLVEVDNVAQEVEQVRRADGLAQASRFVLLTSGFRA